jgi:hypothetical protein
VVEIFVFCGFGQYEAIDIALLVAIEFSGQIFSA